MTTPPGTETRIQIVYPHADHEVYDDSTFLMGQVRHFPQGGVLLINGKSIPISTQGFFAWKVPIHAGMNPMRLEVRHSPATPPVAQEMFALHGVPPLSVLPALPLQVHTETLMPAEDVWLSVGNLIEDTLTVACSASEQASIHLTIPGWLDEPIVVPSLTTHSAYVDTREVIFAEKHWTGKRIPARGYYQAQIPVSELLRQAGEHKPLPQNLPMVLHVQHNGHTLQKTLPGRLTILKKPRLALGNEDRLVTRTIPPNGARLTPQRSHTRFWIDGLERGWARVRLSREESFYVAQKSVSLLQDESFKPLSLAIINSRPLGAYESEIKLAFQEAPTSACPIQVAVLPAERMNRLQVRLYGVCSQCDFIHYPPQDKLVRQIHWRQVAENTLELWIDLHQSIAGYDYAWRDGAWYFTVQALPSTISDIRILIDPGHGGSEWGSTGLNGLPEKKLNLAVSRLLKTALIEAGFQVDLTRDADVPLSLPERGEAVLREKPHMVLSLHHNALPDGRDPLKAQGACTFYYHPFSKPLAENLLTWLTEAHAEFETIPSYGLFYDSLYMTRIHQALAVLIEVGFFTHPDEFERLIQPEFQQQVAQRLTNALVNYCVARG